MIICTATATHKMQR